MAATQASTRCPTRCIRIFRDQNQVFSGLVCRTGNTYSIGFQGRTELVEGEDVSGNYFSVLGVGAAVGRVLTAAEQNGQSN